jgi:GTP cyclohydrolase IA
MKTKKIEYHTKNMIAELGLDLNDPNLKDTPKRIAKMYQKDFMGNVHKKPSAKLLRSFPNEKEYDEIILMDNIPFVSLCSHHFLPFPGLACFLYIPDKKLVGASKPARIIEFFSKKPQLQENLAFEVVNHFSKIKPKGIMLVMRAIHGCMSCRGIKTGENAGLVTSITYGSFRDNIETRTEALDLIKLSVALRK